jgi:cystathionine beta-lyase
VVTALTVAILSCTQPGDKVIIQPPVYFPFSHSVKNSGRQLIENRLKIENGRYVMDYEALEIQMKDPRARMLILCSPHNPVGRVWTAEELRRLADLCLQNNIVLVSDEIHCDLVFSGQHHTTTASLSPEIAQITITLVSPSKTFNLAGLNSSIAIIPDPELLKRYAITSEATHVGGSSIFGILGLETAYTSGEEWLDQLLVYLECNLDTLENFIRQRIPRLKIYRPQGTYMAWLDCRDLSLTPAELHSFILKQAGLGLNDGAAFGPGGEGFQRINFACRRALLQQALEQLEAAVNSL